MPRVSLVAFFILFFIVSLNSQVYHYKTGKALGVSEANHIVWKNGIFNNFPARYGTLVVKENRSIPESRLITIPVVHIKAINSNDSLSPIFLLNGGPGESNLQTHILFDKLVQSRDIVLVGYRGVDGQVKLNCPCLENAFLSKRLTIKISDNLFAQAIDSCLANYRENDIDIAGYSMEEVIADIEITREILKYDSISFLAFSYGTMLAQLYYNNYNAVVSKMAFLGARPLDKFLFEGEILNEQLVNLLGYLSADSTSFSTPEQSVEHFENLLINTSKILPEFNEYRFLFYWFSKLYTLDEAVKLYTTLNNINPSDASNILNSIDEFYGNFPSKVVLGDIVAKKQGKVSKNDHSVSTFGDKLSFILNTFYSPDSEFLHNITPTKPDPITLSDVLYVIGDHDIASPQIYVDTSRNTLINIENAGHLDLFYTKRDIVESYLIDYFRN